MPARAPTLNQVQLKRTKGFMKNYLNIIKNGIITENPTFVLLLGMCPTLATTSSAINGM